MVTLRLTRHRLESDVTKKLLFTLLLFIHALRLNADALDDLIEKRMAQRSIPGLSIAIIQNGMIVKAKGYGFTDRNRKTPVTTATLFQAGSISKSVSAMSAMRLVQEGKLSLDADVNTALRSWKVPDNPFTKEKKPTLRGILNHTAGFNMHGFTGYVEGDRIPTLLQVLEGVQPAYPSESGIRIESVPGSTWRYSGGGYTVMQQLLIDVTGKSFPQFMFDAVLKPLGMMNSTFEQPLPALLKATAASGHNPMGNPTRGLWRVHPEMAAAGLWTTPSDLARFVIGIQEQLAGTANPVLSQTMTEMMLTRQPKACFFCRSDDALGVFIDGKNETLRFSHDGSNLGFESRMVGFAHTGQGAIMMININDDFSKIWGDIFKAIAQEYHWPSSL
jgi:CubicO group peptidase (beta-lactamase class C family)